MTSFFGAPPITPIPNQLPYHSNKNPFEVWEAYGKGVPLLGFLGEIPNDIRLYWLVNRDPYFMAYEIIPE